MAIWFGGFPLEYANERAKDSLIAHLGVVGRLFPR